MTACRNPVPGPHGPRASPRASPRAFTLIEVMIVIFIIGVLAAIAQPAYKKYRDNALTRACFKNQKLISSSLQNYNLDKNLASTALPAVLDDMVDSGYLQTLPLDPGSGSGSQTNYLYTGGGFNVKCAIHGMLE